MEVEAVESKFILGGKHEQKSGHCYSRCEVSGIAFLLLNSSLEGVMDLVTITPDTKVRVYIMRYIAVGASREPLWSLCGDMHPRNKIANIFAWDSMRRNNRGEPQKVHSKSHEPDGSIVWRVFPLENKPSIIEKEAYDYLESLPREHAYGLYDIPFTKRMARHFNKINVVDKYNNRLLFFSAEQQLGGNHG